MHSLRLVLLVALAFVLSWTVEGRAQNPSQDSTTTAHVVASSMVSPQPTLAGWMTERRRNVLDRRHAYGDRLYDRGVFRHITPPMDREYALDMTTYRFSPVEEDVWQRLDNGMRMRTGSIVRAKWAFITEIKHTHALGDRHSLRFDATLQQDGQAQRSLLEANYDWLVAPTHHVGVRHTFTQYKSDLDPSFYYQYGNRRQGRLRAELTLLDAYHNLIFQTLGVSDKDEDFVRTFEETPYMGQLTLETPPRFSLRGELRVAWQPERGLVVQSQSDSLYRYRDRTAFHYGGALLEYQAGPVTGGLILQRDKSSLSRLGLRDSVSSDYWTAQRLKRGGAFLLGSWGPFHGEAWFFLEDYYDRQDGDDFSLSTVRRSMNYTEYRKNYRARITYQSSQTGWFGSIAYLAMSRRLGPEPWILGNEWTDHWYSLAPSNYRLSGVVGFRFDQGAVALGINFDLDGDKHFKAEPDFQRKRFDNGYIRFALSW